jgi:DNA replication protein DnaC
MMQPLAVEFQKLRSAGEALPDDGACSQCGYFDVQHPDVRRILIDRDSTKRLLYQAQCKCQNREDTEQRDKELRYAQSGLPRDHQRTVGNFKARTGTEPMVKAAKRFIDREGPRMLVLVGRTGTGKSHLLESIGHHALDAGRTARYDLASTFLNRLRHTYDSDSGEDVHDLLSWYHRRDTLLIDDIGVESPSPWVREQLTTLVEERLHGARWTAIATNLNKNAMADRMGDRLASRLWATNPDLSEVEIVINTAQDYRS